MKKESGGTCLLDNKPYFKAIIKLSGSGNKLSAEKNRENRKIQQVWLKGKTGAISDQWRGKGLFNKRC